jgi:hypothetical protein
LDETPAFHFGIIAFSSLFLTSYISTMALVATPPHSLIQTKFDDEDNAINVFLKMWDGKVR